MGEKFITDHPLPNDHEREVLTIMLEECCEVGQRITKILRFGANDVQAGQDKTNLWRLSEEIGQLLHMMDKLEDLGLLDVDAISAGEEAKGRSLDKYLQTEKPEAEPEFEVMPQDAAIFGMAASKRLTNEMAALPHTIKSRVEELIGAGLLERTETAGIQLTPEGVIERARLKA